MKGQLREHPLAELINEISDAGLSGVLRLERKPAKAFVYFEDGAIVFAATNLRMHRLSTLLWQWGQIAPERLAAMGADTLSDEQMDAALASSGLVSAEELTKIRARQSEEALRPPLLWTEGTWAFNPQARMASRTHAPLETGPLLLEAARRLPCEFIAARLRNGEEIISPSRDADASAQLQPEEGFVLSRIDAHAKLGEIVAVSGLPEEQTRQAIYALAVCGLIRRESAPRAFSEEAIAKAKEAQAEAPKLAPTETPQAAATNAPVADESKAKEESDPLANIEVLFSQASGQTHYEVLGVGRAAPPAEIKRAYYSLARRFHPDRFRRDAEAELFTRIESAFGRIAKAYEVLKDTKLRASYDLKMQARSTSGRTIFSNDTSEAAKGSAAANEQRNTDSTDRAETCFRQGMAALESGDSAAAERLLAEAARLSPKQPRYRAFYGRTLALDRSKRRQAETELQTAVSLDPNNAEYRVLLAELYRDVGLRRRAVGELERALSINPNHAAARRLLNSLKGEV